MTQVFEQSASLDGVRFMQELRHLRYDRFVGVPCSSLVPLIDALTRSGAPYLGATREDAAVGVAAGMALAGHRPAVLMQNSGLGLAINALLSLTRLYELPLLLVVSWRGWSDDAPEHLEMGRRLPELLEALDVPHRLALAEDAFSRSFHSALKPIALLVRPGDLF
jgi:sulfopyruvate decarboxylase alpha subunit